MVTQFTNRVLLWLLSLLIIFSHYMYYFYTRRCEKLDKFICCFNVSQMIFHKFFTEIQSYAVPGGDYHPVRQPSPRDGPQRYMPHTVQSHPESGLARETSKTAKMVVCDFQG